jgi:hypothetical protein
MIHIKNNNTDIKIKSVLKKRDSNINGISSSINEWLSESSNNPSIYKNKYQNNHDCDRYKYRQISEAENDLNNNHHYVKKICNRNIYRSQPNAEYTEAKINKNNNEIESIADATVVTYESWNSLAMFQPKTSERKKARIIDCVQGTGETYNFKKLLKSIDEDCKNRSKFDLRSFKKTKETPTKNHFLKSNNHRMSKLEHNTIRKWLNKNESKYSKYSAHNQLKNIQMKFSSSSNFETIPSTESSVGESVDSDSILKNFENNKVLNQSTKNKSIKIDNNNSSNLHRGLSQKDNKIFNNNNGFISIARNLRMSYLKAAAGRIVKGVCKNKESFKFGIESFFTFSFVEIIFLSCSFNNQRGFS